MQEKNWTIFAVFINAVALGLILFLIGEGEYIITLNELALGGIFTGLLLLLSLGTAIGSGADTQSTITLPLILPAIYLLGPFWGSIVAALGTILPAQLKKDFPFDIFLTNRSMMFIAGALGGLWLAFLPTLEFEWTNLWVIGAMGITFSLLNNGLLWLGLWATGKLSYDYNFFLFALERAKSVFISTLVAVVFIILYQSHGLPGVLILFALVFLFRDILQARFQQVNSFFQVIESFARIIDTKDPYTRGHSERVARFAEDISKKAGISPIRIPRLVQAAKLHDVGKLEIPESILLKPGSLTRKEYNRVKNHPVRGEMLLKDVEMLSDLLDIIRFHHERYDGKGYPDGLKGEEIPLEARILAIADAFDCMSTDRVYRRAKGKAEIISELKKCSGTQFDPKLSRILIKMLEEGYYDQELAV